MNTHKKDQRQEGAAQSIPLGELSYHKTFDAIRWKFQQTKSKDHGKNEADTDYMSSQVS